MNRRGSVFYHLRESFWFLPAVMSLAAIGGHFLIRLLDARTQEAWILGGGPSAAREMLSVVAISSLTVAGMVFSITMVTLSIAASQFGPRLIRNFMRDTGTQVVFGTMLATFVYSLLTLPQVDTGADGSLPPVALLLTTALALASIGMLIFFIHHTAASVQAESVVARLGRDLHAVIARHAHQRVNAGPESDGNGAAADSFIRHGTGQVEARRYGFVQTIDYQRLARAAGAVDARVVIKQRPGGFVAMGEPLVYLDPAGADMEAVVREAYLIGSERTLEQDVSFGLEELVDVAVRALSPAIKLPFLAALCVNHLGTALARLAEEGTGPYTVCDDAGTPRVLVEEPSFADLLSVAFDEIRRNGADSMPAVNALYDAFELLASRVQTSDQGDAVLRQGELLYERTSSLLGQVDREQVRERHGRLVTGLQERRTTIS